VKERKGEDYYIDDLEQEARKYLKETPYDNL
jgi:hypothetical protein